MMIAGVGSNVKAISDQVPALSIVIFTNDRPSDAAAPTRPPMVASTIDSRRNEVRMLLREKPSARSVPISRWRFATCAFMVMVAPIMAPIEKSTAIIVPMMVRKIEVASDCFS